MRDFLTETRKTLNLALPIILGLVGQRLLELIDMKMIGMTADSVTNVAAASLAAAAVTVPVVTGYGLCMPVQLLVARAEGARDHRESGQVLRQGILLALAFSATAAALLHWQIDFLHLLGQPPHVAERAENYTAYLLWSMVPMFVYTCLKNYTEALNHPWEPLVVLVGSFGLNILLNWIFIFGNLGAPAMGIDGAGLATLLARATAVVGLGVWVLRGEVFPAGRELFHLRQWSGAIARRILGIGVPTGLQIIFEVATFAMATVMMGWIDETHLAAHNIAMGYAATTFMVPLGMSFAVSIRIGQAYGANNWERIRRIGWYSILFAVLFESVFALLYMLFRHELPLFILDDAEVVALASQFLIVAAMFQVFDGAQITVLGALRGLADMKRPTQIMLLIYWVLVLPLAYLLAFEAGLGGMGIWVGLATGLALAAITFCARFHWMMRARPEQAGS